jgi:hypothetical protein
MGSGDVIGPEATIVHAPFPPNLAAGFTHQVILRAEREGHSGFIQVAGRNLFATMRPAISVFRVATLSIAIS